VFVGSGVCWGGVVPSGSGVDNCGEACAEGEAADAFGLAAGLALSVGTAVGSVVGVPLLCPPPPQAARDKASTARIAGILLVRMGSLSAPSFLAGLMIPSDLIARCRPVLLHADQRAGTT
jgi:hypothetical protein